MVRIDQHKFQWAERNGRHHQSNAPHRLIPSCWILMATFLLFNKAVNASIFPVWTAQQSQPQVIVSQGSSSRDLSGNGTGSGVSVNESRNEASILLTSSPSSSPQNANVSLPPEASPTTSDQDQPEINSVQDDTNKMSTVKEVNSYDDHGETPEKENENVLFTSTTYSISHPRFSKRQSADPVPHIRDYVVPPRHHQRRSSSSTLPDAHRRRSSTAAATTSTATTSTTTRDGVPSSQPLQTLERLRQMLDETDYMMMKKTSNPSPPPTRQQSNNNADNNNNIEERDLHLSSPTRLQWEELSERIAKGESSLATSLRSMPRQEAEQDKMDQLWTSKDRSKYKRQRRRETRAASASRKRQIPRQPYRLAMPLHPHHSTSDNDDDDDDDDNNNRHRNRNNSNVDDDGDDETDDGLGYTLPNLPVYMSDQEGDEDDDDGNEDLEVEHDDESEIEPEEPPLQQSRYQPLPSYWPHHQSQLQQQLSLIGQQQQQQPRDTRGPSNDPSQYPPQYGPYYAPPFWPPPPGFQQQQQQQAGSSPYYQQPVQQQSQAGNAASSQPPYYPSYNGYYYPPQGSYPYPYPPYGAAYPPRQQSQPARQYRNDGPQQQRQEWGARRSFVPGYPSRPYQQRLHRQVPRKPEYSSRSYQGAQGPSPLQRQAPNDELKMLSNNAAADEMASNELDQSGADSSSELVVYSNENLLSPSLTHAVAESYTKRFTLDSWQKISFLAVTVVLVSYSAVSPRHLPPTHYHRLALQNLRLIGLSLLAPFFNWWLITDDTVTAKNNINHMLSTFFASFSVGYLLVFGLELVATTLIRLGVFWWWERQVFQLPVPMPIVPWVLREHRYRPKRITLFLADFLTTCVASPIIEEYCKLKILEWTVQLPRNFYWVIKTSSKNKRKRRVAEAIPRSNANEPEVTNINSYVTQMFAASMGLKVCDMGRRILMYTKANDAHKGFYALMRGVFPIHELCGTMTALGLAKRDVLGVDLPVWKILLPAVVIHGMANFRGKKPVFKWNSATPWSEMQLFPWNSDASVEGSAIRQLLSRKGFAKLMWIVILCRVLGYCVKNYFLVNRQAIKRTTTFAGNHAAFSAELAATEALKKKEQ